MSEHNIYNIYKEEDTLINAAKNGQLEIIKDVITNYLTDNTSINNRNRLLLIAKVESIENNHEEVLNYLMEKSPSSEEELYYLFQIALRTKNLLIIFYLFELVKKYKPNMVLYISKI